MLWRRSYDVPPPPIADDDPLSQVGGPALRRAAARAGAADRMPQGRRRAACCPTGTTRSCADLAAGRTVLVVAHGNSLRALVKHLDGISDEDIAALNIPTGIPLVYELDDDFRVITPGGRYLDPEAAAESAQAVAQQGARG